MWIKAEDRACYHFAYLGSLLARWEELGFGIPCLSALGRRPGSGPGRQILISECPDHGDSLALLVSSVFLLC